ncbi:hypothetical protein HG15A2_45040 [Adhaeretor mobilis]|uniref:Choice-of-anchor I domain-containing protein n=2 Tax=Adhaeretor mobilis TaxID=1930276 RepID=A0A517N1Z8_9BACT|nr:hypothetical protein HG15A2_45040 [Adhaeretor mobilis]
MCKPLIYFALAVAAVVSANGGAAAFDANVLWRVKPPVQTVEIAALDTTSSALFVTTERGILSVRLADGVASRRLLSLPDGFHATSVAASDGRVAIALASINKRQPGRIDLHNASSLKPLITFPAGHHPDMVCFSPDGRFLVVANEGEPTDDYEFDGTGSVTVVDLVKGFAQAEVSQCSFEEFDIQSVELRSQGVRLFGPSKTHHDGRATVAEDLEPEYIACSQDGRRAWVTLQENNAIAEVDLLLARVTNIHALGKKDFRHVPGAHSLAVGTPSATTVSYSNVGYSTTGLDASDQDDHLQAQLWPVKASFEPDAIAHFSEDGIDYLVTANEGDPRDYINYREAAAAADLPGCLLAGTGRCWDHRAPARHLLQPNQLGRLQVSIEECDPDHDGDIDELHAFGTRSFSVWRASGNKLELVFDSGSDFERLLSLWAKQETKPASYLDSRSHVRGPEPEGVVLGQIAGRRYAFIGLERASGIMVYDLTEPTAAKYCCYIPPAEEAGIIDASPEGLVFVPESESPTKQPLLVVCNEYSGTITAYELNTSVASH